MTEKYFTFSVNQGMIYLVYSLSLALIFMVQGKHNFLL